MHVSWNGATEVATWNLYKTDAHGNIETAEPAVSLPRTGFETALTFHGFATYVVVEALDDEGNVLGRSRIVKTVVSAKLSILTVTQEAEWLESVGRRWRAGQHNVYLTGNIPHRPGFMFGSGIVCGMALLVASRALWRAKRKGTFSRRWGEPLYKLVSQFDDSEKT